MPEINMPKLSDTMEEGTVLEWKKGDGDSVKKGDVIAEIETDKASFEIEADAEGVLRVVVEAGRPVPVGEVIGTIGDVNGDVPAKAPVEAAAPAPRPEPRSRHWARSPAGGPGGPPCRGRPRAAPASGRRCCRRR